MKKQQPRCWLGLCVAVTIFEVVPLATPANAQNCQAYNSSVVTSIRRRNVPTGNILINNNYGPNPQSGAVTIRLYHSNATDRIFSIWNFAGGELANLSDNNGKLVIGGDWGIQVVFGNGVTSCISPVADVGRFESGRYVILATDIHDRRITQSQTQPSRPQSWQSKLPSVRDQIIRELESNLSRLARGNQGYARIDALRVEGSDLYVKILIHHKHRPSGIGVPYSLQTWIETRYNPLNNQATQDRTQLCVRGPRIIGSPNMCVTAGEVVRIISAFL
jgi:hypothetical protein